LLAYAVLAPLIVPIADDQQADRRRDHGVAGDLFLVLFEERYSLPDFQGKLVAL